jgi:hypothetical protein
MKYIVPSEKVTGAFIPIPNITRPQFLHIMHNNIQKENVYIIIGLAIFSIKY